MATIDGYQAQERMKAVKDKPSTAFCSVGGVYLALILYLADPVIW